MRDKNIIEKNNENTIQNRSMLRMLNLFLKNQLMSPCSL